MNDENLITYFAETNFRNERRKFGIKRADRRRHMYLIGKTGMGKSTMLENMIIQDIRNGEGLAVVDPHGDLVEKILDYIPSERINDVIYFNPSDYEHPIAFNILEKVDPQYKHLVSNGLVGVFKKIWADSWGPRLEYILTNTILALLEYPNSTLLGVMRMLVDGAYRKKVVKKIEDPVVRSFWINEFNNYSEKFRNEAIAPIQNKVGQFLSSSLIRNIVGQPKSSMDMRELMDNQKIILLNLSKGRIGEENSALLGAMMITKMQLAAMSRVDIVEEERKDFYLYVDEFQNFATDSFAGILSEARKYRLDLIMAHQYIEQLGDEVRAAVFGNVGTMVAFRVGATDAEELEKEFAPTFTGEDVVTLPAYHTYLRLMIDGVASDPFSATTMPPLSGKTENREKVIRVSRERYANPREKVEQNILQWSDHPSAGGQNNSADGNYNDAEESSEQIKGQDTKKQEITDEQKKVKEEEPKNMAQKKPPARPTVDVSSMPAPPYTATQPAQAPAPQAPPPPPQKTATEQVQFPWSKTSDESEQSRGINFIARLQETSNEPVVDAAPEVAQKDTGKDASVQEVKKEQKKQKDQKEGDQKQAHPRKKSEEKKDKKEHKKPEQKEKSVSTQFSSIEQALPNMPQPISATSKKKKKANTQASREDAPPEPVKEKVAEEKQESAEESSSKKKRRRRRKRKKPGNSGDSQQNNDKQQQSQNNPQSKKPQSIQPGQRIQF